MDELLRSFAEHPVPGALLELWSFQEELGEDYSGDFALVADGREALLAWFSGRRDLASQFVVFGADRAKSLYGFWLYPGRTLETAPVVYLNAERCDNTVLTSNLKDFLALLTLDRDEPGMLGLWGERLEVTGGHLRFVDWLKERSKIERPEDPGKLVADARAAHPDLDAWVEDTLTFDEG